jgi:hypothetical protein
MPMTAVFIVAVILALWVLYDSGELMSDRIRLQNTADNVAYSTAALISRDLNFIAYTNRGMVANQVAIAQMVGLSSWAASIEQFAVTLDTIGRNHPYTAPLTSASLSAASASSNAMDAFARRMIPINERVIEGLSQAQAIFHQGFVLQIASFGQEVAQGNDPDAYPVLAVGGASLASAAAATAAWNERIGAQYRLRRVSDGSAEAQLENRRYREFDAVVQNSRDRFSANRSYRWPPPFEGLAPPFRWRTRKYGGTEFLRTTDPGDERYRWDWAAMETVSLYPEVYDPLDGWERLGEIPLAWGAAHALDESRRPNPLHDYGYSSARRNRALWGNGTWRNRNAARFMLRGPMYGGKDHVRHELGSIEGLREFHEFRDDAPQDQGPEVIALYVKDEARIHSQSRLVEGGGGRVAPDLDTRAAGGLAGGRLAAVAKAQPYYARPTDLETWRRGDRRLEHGSLYNPYWQPRLVDLTDAERAAATAIASGGAIGGSS